MTSKVILNLTLWNTTYATNDGNETLLPRNDRLTGFRSLLPIQLILHLGRTLSTQLN
jgi:hypothetical protein